jgi:cobalamin biosynthesis Mg chelatase CobN
MALGGRGRRWALGLLPATALAAAASTILAVPGYAACHSFTVGVSPASVNEGGSTTATVSRDGNVNPSSIQVDTVDESAVAGRDYVAFHQRLSFTTETSMTFQVTTIHNPSHEGSQTFRIQLSSGMGCTVNPNFVYGTPARVTVLDIDPAPAPAPTQSRAPTQPAPTSAPAAATAAPGATATADLQAVAPSPSASAESSPSASPSSSPALATAPTSPGGPGTPVPLVLGLMVVVAAAGAGGFYWYRRRTTV